MPGMTWDGAADSKLLLSILTLHDVKVDYIGVSALMGPDCTACAVQQRLKKLKKIAAEAAGDTPVKATSTKTAAKAPKATSAKDNTTKKAAIAKKQSAKKSKLLRTGTPDVESDNASNDGDVSDDEATPSAHGHTNGTSTPNKKVAKATNGLKRKAEDDGISDSELKVKKEKVESDAEDGKCGHAEEEHEEADPSSEQLWGEVSYGMEHDGLVAI